MAGRDIWLGRAVAVIALVAAIGCGGGGGSDAESGGDADSAVAAEQDSAPGAERSSAAEQASEGQASAEESGPMLLTSDDLDRYRKGRQAEIEDVKKKAAALTAAKNQTDSLDALGALTNEAERTRAGADAAGMTVAQYSRMTSAVDNVLGAYSMSEMMLKGQKDVDTSSLDAEARAQIRSNIAAAQEGLKRLPEANVKLVVPHAAELDSLRLLPAAMALKAAGA
ncbi:MAG TPA: hypothetical protein VIP79_04310 [Gemmatimonadaceae bacterium]